MIRHCVMFDLPPGHDADMLDDIMQGLAQVAARLPGCGGFLAGPNVDLEGKSPDCRHGFTLDFVDRDAVRTYAQDAAHRAFGARLVKLCGGADRLIVFDIEVAD